MKKNILFILTAVNFFSIFTAAAGLPDQLPLTLADARIYAISNSTRMDRSANSQPIGQVRLMKGDQEVSNYAIFWIPSPSMETISATVKGDVFDVILPTAKQAFDLSYRTYDKYGNQMLMGNTYSELTPSKNPATPYSWGKWSQEVWFNLPPNFTFELDAQAILIEEWVEGGEKEAPHVERTFLTPTERGGKKFFTIPSWGFYSESFQNGITTVYSTDGTETCQYSNLDGKVAGTMPLTFLPVAEMSNHFRVEANVSETTNVVSAWNNMLENPSFEFTPSLSQGVKKGLTLKAQTSEGVAAIGIVITIQDAKGGSVKTEIPLTLDADNFGTQTVEVIGGNTYFYRYVWPETVNATVFRG